MEAVILYSFLFGLVGGIVRGLVGIAKYLEKNKASGKLSVKYFALPIGIAALVGGVAGSLVSGDWRLAIIAGYAGTDFLEGLYKIRMKQGFEI